MGRIIDTSIIYYDFPISLPVCLMLTPAFTSTCGPLVCSHTVITVKNQKHLHAILYILLTGFKHCHCHFNTILCYLYNDHHSIPF